MSTNAHVLDHVAIGVADVGPVAGIVVGALGGREVSAGPGVGFRFWQWEFARGGRLEILEPDGPAGGFLHRFIERRGPGIHHVTFKVPRIEDATGRAEALGYEIVGFDDRSPSWKEAFLHPRQAQGIVVQLAESHPQLESDAEGEWRFPEAPPPAAPPADLLGLRMRATSEALARRQWEAALGGECETRDDGLVFRWPESPLRVGVHIDPSAPPAALGIELAAGTPAPPDAERVLGTRLLPTPE